MTSHPDTPRRIQRKRTKGWKMPENTVYVGRPSKWGNPFWCTSRQEAEVAASVDYYRRWLEGEPGLGADPAEGRELAYQVSELRGKNLACWCPLDEACHGDVLLRIANDWPK